MRYLVAFLLCISFQLRAEEVPFSNLECRGASNTNGQTATFPFCLHMKSVLLNSLKEDQKQKLSSKKILVGFDYFYPSHFDAFYGDINVEQVVLEKLQAAVAEGFDLILLGEVPSRKGLSQEAEAYLNLSTNFLSVVESLEQTDGGQRAAEVNAALNKAASRLEFQGKVRVLSFKDLFTNYYTRAMKYSYSELGEYVPYDRSMFEDPIHINDLGQVFVMNEWVFPELNTQLNMEIPKARYRKISDNRKLRILAPFVKSSSDFHVMRQGSYWGAFVDTQSVRRESGVLVLPKAFTGSESDEVLTLDKFDRITEVRNSLKRDDQRALTQLYGIASLMEYGDENGSDGLLVSVHNSPDGDQQIILNLEQTLNYVKTVFSPNELGMFETWGYDYWSSYSYPLFFRKLQKMKRAWDEVDFETPAVNYHFSLQRYPENPGLVTVRMTIFPLVQIDGQKQPGDLVRLPEIPEPWGTEVRESGEQNYPHLIYNIDVQIQDL